MQELARTRALAAVAALAALVVCVLPATAAGKKRAPRLAAPSQGVALDSIPSFAWKKVRGAEKYEFQLSADRQFESIVLGQGRGSFQTRNTFATIDQTLPNGDYFWRVRSINGKENAGKWSDLRKLRKSWNEPPQLVSPIQGEAIAYPQTPLVLRWNPVPGAYKYLLWIGTDPSLASVDKPIETSATVFSPVQALGPGRYYWAVTPIDSQKHLGVRSQVGSFVWTWPSKTTPEVFDLNESVRVFDPQFSWDPIPGASRYEVEINPSSDFAPGSKVCCNEVVIGTSLSPKDVLPNNSYYWRVRAVDLDGQAGQWNYGDPFRKAFDDVLPSIPNLHMRDYASDTPTDKDTATSVLDTSYPIVRWDPVPGATSYKVNVVPYDMGFCNWSASSGQWNVTTASTAWTPLASRWNGRAPGVAANATSDAGRALVDGRTYCVSVIARSDRDAKTMEVLSPTTYIGGINTPAFRWDAPPAPTGALGYMQPTDYREPQLGSVNRRMPLFTWNPDPAAGSYFVIVAKDPDFTQVIDMALTTLPMYAPRKTSSSQTYPDETTSYYWAVVPATDSNGNGALASPIYHSPRHFQKQSVPPTLLTPQNGADAREQVVFRWTSTEGAREYNIQVATDESFSTLLDDVKTSATSYTSERTYPADTVLYWRVRASDENLIGLTWSQIGTFRRRLPVPTLFTDNPLGGETIPVLRWHPVEGATSYDMHVDQSDGTRVDLHLRGTAFTAVRWYGTGIWHWQVRANFPGGLSREVQGGYTKAVPFTRHIATPGNPRAINRDRHTLLQWNPAPMAKSYRVQVATTDSFSQLVDSASTDHTEWAPKLLSSSYIAGGKFWWRVAAVDEGGNVGGWRTSKLKLRRGFLLRATGFIRKRTKGVAEVLVRDGRLRPIRKAKVIVKGAGTKRRARRTNGQGIAKLPVRPRRSGSLKFLVKKRGFRAGKTTLKIY